MSGCAPIGAPAAFLLLFDLPEFEVDRRGAAEDGHSDFDARSGFVDFLDYAIEGGERPVRHPHIFANLEAYRSFGRLDAVGLLSLDPIRFNIGNRSNGQVAGGLERPKAA